MNPLSTRSMAFATLLISSAANAQSRVVSDYDIHSRTRAKPRTVTPGPAVSMKAPSDAIVLFDGTSLAKWEQADGKPARWRVIDGAFEVAPKTGMLRTRESFGDVQLHIEWMAPNPPHGTDQDRGNSGVFLGGDRYEVQVLDSYQSETYADGQAGALYGQYPPLVNAVRPPGEWQSYDIVFRRPRFDGATLVSPVRVTVILNGVLVQDGSELTGPTGHYKRPPYEAHADRLPISLQDHDHPVRFRNVWIRDLETPLGGASSVE